MVTSRALVERNELETMRLISHGPDESPAVGAALQRRSGHGSGRPRGSSCSEDRADHIDLNFGCPVPKVTRKGGGSAIPWKTRALPRHRRFRCARGRSPYAVPVTVKMRVGIDDAHVTYLERGSDRRGGGRGSGRTARPNRRAGTTSGQADWSAIARLREAVTSVPVLGNGDIWSAEDARADGG
jgi:tRNA-dihydrouridine synthase